MSDFLERFYWLYNVVVMQKELLFKGVTLSTIENVLQRHNCNELNVNWVLKSLINKALIE